MIMFIVTMLMFTGIGIVIVRAHHKTTLRLYELERNLHDITDVVSKMTELEARNNNQFSHRFDELEERIMELSVPSHDPDLPLERRHQVLALARQGAGLEDIVKRLKAPVGEAELILNLHNYRDGARIRSAGVNEQVVPYV
jgi:hypothetical protein